MSMPLAVWVDRHNLTVVTKDGLPVEPSGPHEAWVLNAGERYDVIVSCNQPSGRYKLFADLGRTYYPGIIQPNPESSYALLEYATASPSEPVEEAQWPPGRSGGWYPSKEHYRTFSNDFGTWHSVGGLAQLYLPATVFSLRPIEAASVPAAAARFQINVRANGNWHQYSRYDLTGTPLEWWTVNGHSPLRAPAEPLLLTKSLSLPVTSARSFGVSGAALPYVATLEYVAAEPKWYEFTLVNYEGQQHPWHLHGFTCHVIGWGWLNHSCGYTNACGVNGFESGTDADGNLNWEGTDANPGARRMHHLARFDEPAAVITVGDTFTVPPRSWITFRIRADNPGAWLAHCHMDYHLAVGMGFVLSVEAADGSYSGLTPPPADLRDRKSVV